MKWLELKIPPVVVLALLALLTAYLSRFQIGVFHPSRQSTTAAVVLFFFGAALCLTGIWQFRRAKTTVHPSQPEQIFALVKDGIYRYTRNPMYLGFALALCAQAVYSYPVLAIRPVVLFAAVF